MAFLLWSPAKERHFEIYILSEIQMFGLRSGFHYLVALMLFIVMKLCMVWILLLTFVHASCNHSVYIQYASFFSLFPPHSLSRNSPLQPHQCQLPLWNLHSMRYSFFDLPFLSFLQFLYIVQVVFEPTSWSIWKTPPLTQQPSSIIRIVLFPVAVNELFCVFESGLITEPSPWTENADHLLNNHPKSCHF